MIYTTKEEREEALNHVVLFFKNSEVWTYDDLAAALIRMGDVIAVQAPPGRKHDLYDFARGLYPRFHLRGIKVQFSWSELPGYLLVKRVPFQRRLR